MSHSQKQIFIDDLPPRPHHGTRFHNPFLDKYWSQIASISTKIQINRLMAWSLPNAPETDMPFLVVWGRSPHSLRKQFLDEVKASPLLLCIRWRGDYLWVFDCSIQWTMPGYRRAGKEALEMQRLIAIQTKHLDEDDETGVIV